MMKKMKIGVLGCASIAERMMIPAIKSSKNFELVAVASRSSEKAKIFAEKFECEALEGYENLLARQDIETVYIPLPPSLHHEWAMKAMEKGKHCFVEKPITPDYSSTKDMLETAQKKNLVVFEDFMFVYHTQHRFIRQQLKNNAIGEIRCFRSSFGFPPLPRNDIRYNQSLGGGALLDAGVYTLKASQMILGKNLDVQTAYLNVEQESGVDLFGGALLSNPSGLFAQLAFGMDNYYQCNFEIWGSKGKITAERAFTAGPGIKPKVIVEKQDEYHTYILPADNHFIRILQDFYNSILGKKPSNHFNEILNQAYLLEEVKKIAIKT